MYQSVHACVYLETVCIPPVQKARQKYIAWMPENGRTIFFRKNIMQEFEAILSGAQPGLSFIATVSFRAP